MIKSCPYCGKEFEATYFHRVYCSDECCLSQHRIMERQRRQREPKKPPVILKCKYCGKEFERKNNYQKYCSPECLRKFSYENSILKEIEKKYTYEKQCVICGSTFKTGHSNAICCSEKCSIENRKRLLKEFKIKQREEDRKVKYSEKPLCHECGKPTNGTYRCQKCKDKFYKSLGYPQSNFTGDNDVD